MWPLSTAAKIALIESHSVTARATVYSPTLGQGIPLPLAGGSVSVDSTSMVRRTATITVDPRFWPASPNDLLAPYGSYCVVEYGIALRSGGIEWVPLILGYLDKAARSRPLPSDLTVSLVDRSARVAEDRFDAPTQTVSGATVVTEIRRLIQDSLGIGVTVTDLTGSGQVAAVIDIERERWKDGVEKLAESIGAEVFFRADGVGIIRATPTLDDPEVWEIRTGQAGTIISTNDVLSREGVYNRVVASGQRSDGTAPVYAVVSDTDPLSPTQYGGAFGKKPRFYSSALLTTIPQCTTAATSLLARVKGSGANVEFTSLVNPALEPGDIVLAVDDDAGTATKHILDKVEIPLGPDGTQALVTRSLDLPPEQ